MAPEKSGLCAGYPSASVFRRLKSEAEVILRKVSRVRPALKIPLRPDAVPHAVHTPVPVPHYWKEQVKADLKRDVDMGILEPVSVGTPTIWCSQMVVVAKKNGQTR